MNTIEMIIAREQLADPAGAAYYTDAWVLAQCAALGKTPEQYLADRERDEAALIVARDDLAARDGKDAPWAEALKASDPDAYARAAGKFTGAVDRAMLEDGA